MINSIAGVEEEASSTNTEHDPLSPSDVMKDSLLPLSAFLPLPA